METINLYKEGNNIHIVIPNMSIEMAKQLMAGSFLNLLASANKYEVNEETTPVSTLKSTVSTKLDNAPESVFDTDNAAESPNNNDIDNNNTDSEELNNILTYKIKQKKNADKVFAGFAKCIKILNSQYRVFLNAEKNMITVEKANTAEEETADTDTANDANLFTLNEIRELNRIAALTKSFEN